MNILFVSSEVAPFAKTGGLADVAASLPAVLVERGHDVRVAMPFYSSVTADDLDSDYEAAAFQLGARHFSVGVVRNKDSSVPLYLIDEPALFHRGAIYTDGADEHVRFAAFSRAVLQLPRVLDWVPDIIHCNDWQTGLIPLLLKTTYRTDAHVGKARSVLTIHNLGYQGVFGAEAVTDVGLQFDRTLLHQDQSGRRGPE